MTRLILNTIWFILSILESRFNLDNSEQHELGGYQEQLREAFKKLEETE